MKTIVWTGPIQGPHSEQAQENQIIDLSLVHLLKPFCSLDHIGPKLIIKEEVRVDVLPPLVVGSLNVLPGFMNAMECVLGNLQFFISISTSGKKEGNYLECQRVVTITQCWSMFPVVPMTDVPQEPTGG